MEQPILINIYNNLYKFIKKSNLQPIENNQEDKLSFYSNISLNQYIPIVAVSNKFTNEDIIRIKKNIDIYTHHQKDNLLPEDIKSKYNLSDDLEKVVYILLLHNKSEYDNKTANFKSLISRIKYPNCNIIIISKNQLSTHVNKQINELSNDTKKIFNYTYDKFKFLVYNHTLCSKHTILLPEEEDDLLNNVLMIKKSFLPKIKISDVQVVWLGGSIGNIIRIDRDSEITGKSIYYRVVING